MSESPQSLIQLRSRLQNTPLREAVESLPGYTAAMDVLEQSIVRRDALGSAPDSIATEVDEVVRAGVIPDDFAARIAAHHAAVAAHEAAHEGFNILRAQALHRCNSIILANLDLVFEHLNTRLSALTDEAKGPAEVLRDIHGADDAIRAGAGAIRAFEQFDALWQRYAQIREAQSHAIRHFGSSDMIEGGRSNRCRDELANLVFIANLDEVYPQWRYRPEDGHHRHSVDRGPWPEPGPLQLKWLIVNGAHLWVPTKQQLDQVRGHRKTSDQESTSERKAPRDRHAIRNAVPKDDQGRPLWRPAENWPTTTIPA